MFCSCCINRQEQDSRNILDVEEILADYIWNKFLEINGLRRWFLRRSMFHVEVPMSYIRFQVIDEKVTDRTQPGEAEELVPNGNNGTVELKTVYHNGTGCEQAYQFRLEKTRKSTLMVRVQKGFTFGGKANFRIKLPPVSSGVDLDVKYSVTKISGESIEETATFETRSDIKVEKNSMCVARAIMEEISVNCNFRLKILMTFVGEGIPVTVKRKKDGKVFFYFNVRNLTKIFEPYKSEIVDPEPDLDKLRKGNQNSEQIGIRGSSSGNVLFKVQGVIQGSRLSDQRIALESFPLTPGSEQSKPENQEEGISEEDEQKGHVENDSSCNGTTS